MGSAWPQSSVRSRGTPLLQPQPPHLPQSGSVLGLALCYCLLLPLRKITIGEGISPQEIAFEALTLHAASSQWVLDIWGSPSWSVLAFLVSFGWEDRGLSLRLQNQWWIALSLPGLGPPFSTSGKLVVPETLPTLSLTPPTPQGTWNFHMGLPKWPFSCSGYWPLLLVLKLKLLF